MRLLLTGASGFVGATTLRFALEAGHEVAAVVRPGSAARRLAPYAGRFTRIDTDLRHVENLTAAMREQQTDAVLHLAWSGVENAARFDHRQISDNIEVACSLLEAATAASVGAFIGMGSQGEYGAGSTMTEDAFPTPTTLYGAAKVATFYLTRQLAAQAKIRHAWLRLFSTYGPDDNDGWLIPTLITDMLAARRPRTTLGTQFWDWLHVDDVARGILAVATTPTAEGIFNLGSGDAVRVREMVETIRDLAAPGMELVFGEIPFRPDQVMFMQADIRRLREVTGWTPLIAIKDGLPGVVDWYRARGA
jgi:nucleoside-diphosphate-sugar epimerase